MYCKSQNQGGFVYKVWARLLNLETNANASKGVEPMGSLEPLNKSCEGAQGSIQFYATNIMTRFTFERVILARNRL